MNPATARVPSAATSRALPPMAPWRHRAMPVPMITGAITITGLENGASVKIVTSNGMLVNEGTANNGEYKWYGMNREGKRVASGIYMVEVATSDGEKGVVCKIAIVR